MGSTAEDVGQTFDVLDVEKVIQCYTALAAASNFTIFNYEVSNFSGMNQTSFLSHTLSTFSF